MSEYEGITLISGGVRYRVYEGRITYHTMGLRELAERITETFARMGAILLDGVEVEVEP